METKEFLDTINHRGFVVGQNHFDKEMIVELNQFGEGLGPERGHDLNRKWYGWNTIEKMKDPLNEVNWAYYWTKQVEHPHISFIQKELSPYADIAFGHGNWEWYVQDFIVLHPGMNFYRPHIDTPYRFKEFKYNMDLLGLQFMVMMCDFNEDNGATGYVPGTHRYIQDTEKLQKNSEAWESFFVDNYEQYKADAGSFVCWHPRLLHSTMPNKTNEIRRALLMHAAEKKTIRRLQVIDPQSNLNLRST